MWLSKGNMFQAEGTVSAKVEQESPVQSQVSREQSNGVIKGKVIKVAGSRAQGSCKLCMAFDFYSG